MSKAQQILEMASKFEKLTLLKSAADFEAKAANVIKLAKGKVIFPSDSSSIKDKKDHFPINDAAQARNALSRANQFSAAPDWYKGTLQSFVNAVVGAVKKHYPSIEVSKAAKKPGKG